MSNEYFFKSLEEVPFQTPETSPYSKRDFAAVIDIQWNSTGTKVAFSKMDKSIHILDRNHDNVENSQIISNAHERPVEKILFHPLRECEFCSVANDNQIKIWECNIKATSFKLLKTIRLPPTYKNFLCSYSPDGTTLLVVDKLNHITFFDADLYDQLILFKESLNIYDFTWCNTNLFFLLLLGNSMATINSFKSSTHLNHQVVYEINRIHSINSGIPNGKVTQIKFDPRGEFFVTASQQGILQFFSTQSLTCTRTISQIDELIVAIDISRDGTYIVVCFESDLARIYDISDGLENFKLTKCADNGSKRGSLLKFCPNKTGLVSTSALHGGLVFHSKPSPVKQSMKTSKPTRPSQPSRKQKSRI